MGEKFGRLIPYVSFDDKAKASDFTSWLSKQIGSLQAGIDHGVVNDPKKAERFIKTTRKVMNLPTFKSYPNRSMQATRKALKVETGYRKLVRTTFKDLMGIIEQEKLDFFSKDGMYTSKPSDDETMNYLSNVIQLYIATKKLDCAVEIAMIGEIIERTESLLKLRMSITKNSSVEELKAAIGKELADDEYFTDKTFTRMTVKEFMDFLMVSKQIYMRTSKMIERVLKDSLKHFLKAIENQTYYPGTFSSMSSIFDDIIKKYTIELEKVSEEYGVYRFAQGLCERDIFGDFYPKASGGTP